MKQTSVVKIRENQIPENANLLLEDKITSLGENLSVFKTEIPALTLFIIEHYYY